MTTKRFDAIEELRPLRAWAANDGSVDAFPVAEGPLAYDVYRVGDELCIDFDVPGVEPSSIDVALENQFLTVSVTRKINDSGVEVIERGRVHGSFELRLVLPGHWLLDELRASCANGVLRVRAPLAAPSARTVAVEVQASAGVAANDDSLRGESLDVFAVDHERVGSAA